MNLGEKLRSLRLRAKNTLKEQSEVFGVSVNSVYRWEHNLAIPKKSTLRAIADYYNLPLERLLLDSAMENGNGSNGSSLLTEIEYQYISMFRKLSDANKYKVLGYIERMCIEEYGSENNGNGNGNGNY